MSLKKSTTRRLALFTSSSLIAASLAAFAFTGAVLAPARAFAADECTPVAPTLGNGVGPVSDDPALNGAAADSFNCTVATYGTGITYSSTGNLSVAKTNTGNTTVTANGVNLTGNIGDSVVWNSSIGNVVGGAGTAGPVIDVMTDAGDIEIFTSGVTAAQVGTTHAIRATSTGGGDITVSRATGAVNNNVAGGEAAIQAVTSGGSISITTAGVTQSRGRGILAQTSGSGAVTLTLNGEVRAVSSDAVAGVEVIAGTGGVNITKSAGNVYAEAGLALRIASAGAVVIDNSGGFIGRILGGSPQDGAVDFSGVTSGGVTFNNSGTGSWAISGVSTFTDFGDTLTMSGAGANEMRDGSIVDFGAGDDVFTLAGSLTAGGGLNFESGMDTFIVSGVLSVNGMTISGLEVFNHAGVIYMGGASGAMTDGQADDVLSTSATFTGSGSARVAMDVMLIPGEQAGCAIPTGQADCLDLRGGSTAGVTILTFNNVAPAAAQGGYSPDGITVVDVGGGTSSAAHFMLDPNSSGYMIDLLLGPAIERSGLFRYVLRYDAEAQRHVLVGLPRGEVMEYAMLSGAAQTVWHMTADAVTDRQTQLRDGTDAAGLWLRTSGEYSKRRSASSFQGVGQTYTVDTSYKLYAGTIMGGMDLVSGSSGEADYVLGAQIGYVSSSFDLDDAESSGRMTGATGGVYGSVWSDWFFVDGAVNFNGLTLDHEAPALGARTNTYLNSIGARLDAGTRTGLTENTFAEPLVALSWVRTSFEEISVFGGEIQPADAESLRAGLGLRLGATLAGEGVSASYFVTGRGWYEFEGETSGVVRNPGADLPFADEFTGAFGEAEAGVNVFNAANTLSGFLSGGVKWQDGYSAVNLSLGVRMAW